MESLIVALNAVIPFLLYISFGYLVRTVGLTDETFMNRLNQLVFKAFFPILMFYNMYQIEKGFVLNVRLVLFAVASLLILIGLMFAVVPRLEKENPKRGVIIQGIYRSNFVLFAIPLTESIFGQGNTTLASMMVAIIVPIYNVAAVVILEYFRGGELSIFTVIKNVAKNPLILGAFTGFITFLSGISLPQCLVKPISQFAGMTTPLALFVLGGTLHFSKIKGNTRYLILVLMMKMVVIPAVVMGLASFMAFEPIERFLLFSMYATPIAASSYPMAQNMGGDGELAGELVVMSTSISVVTIFLWILFMKHGGII